jgi:thiamine-phosphate pyrophosphorylase
MNERDLLLYLCTDRALSLGRPVLEAVEAAIAGGVSMVQVREKAGSSRAFYQMALELRALTKRLGTPLVVNDRLDIALAVGADGVHLGQSDLPLSAARKLAGAALFIGVSAGTEEEAEAAQRAGADYLGVGPVYPTGSKADARAVLGTERLRSVKNAVRIPVIGIGGISPANAAEVMKTGVAGVAVISAILSRPDIEAAAREMREALGRGRTVPL